MNAPFHALRGKLNLFKKGPPLPGTLPGTRTRRTDSCVGGIVSYELRLFLHPLKTAVPPFFFLGRPSTVVGLVLEPWEEEGGDDSGEDKPFWC